MGGGLESRCVGRVYGADGAVPCNVGTLTFWNPLGHSRPVTGLLYLSDVILNFKDNLSTSDIKMEIFKHKTRSV